MDDLRRKLEASEDAAKTPAADAYRLRVRELIERAYERVTHHGVIGTIRSVTIELPEMGSNIEH